jgi:hypothetical protein
VSTAGHPTVRPTDPDRNGISRPAHPTPGMRKGRPHRRSTQDVAPDRGPAPSGPVQPSAGTS